MAGGICLHPSRRGTRHSDNPDFVEDDSGTSELRGTADLTFSVSSVTKQDQLRFDTGLQLETGQDSDVVTDPFLQLSYGREGANATFSAAANLRITDASSTFINTDSFDNRSLIVDTGEQQAIGLQTALDWGTAAPFGGTISLSHDRSRFVDTSNPDLFDSETTGLENDRDAVSLAFGVRATPNDVLSWDTELSYQTIDLSGGDPNDPINETEEGVGLGFNATYLRPNGNIGLSVSSNTIRRPVRNRTGSGPRLHLSRPQCTAVSQPIPIPDNKCRQRRSPQHQRKRELHPHAHTSRPIPRRPHPRTQ